MPPRSSDDHDTLSPLLPECTPQKLSIDQVLQTWAGEFGCAQLLQCSLVSLVWFLPALLTFITVFSDRTPQWVCTTSLSIGRNTNAPTIDGLVGKSTSNFMFSDETHGGLSCDPSSSICSMDASLWEWSRGDGESTVSQWGLICDQSYKVGLVQCVFFIGTLLGAGIYGSLSDSFLGRRGVLIISCSLSSLLGLVTAFSPNYWVYLVLRMATGFNVGGLGPTAFVLATETVGPSKRGPASMSIFFFYSLGIIMLSTLTFFTISWRHLYLLTSAPGILYCLLALPFVSESPRWHLARGQVDDALAILKQIAVRSGRTIPSTITLETEETSNAQGEADDRSQFRSWPEDQGQPISLRTRGKATTLDIFRVSITRVRMMIMLFIWLSNGLLYYGINLDVPNMGGNISLGLIVNAVAEMPAYLVAAIILQKYGRRPVLVCMMLVSGLSCLLGTVMGGSKSRTWCGAVAIFGAAASYNLVFIYTAELFPTEVRNAALGLAAQAAQVGAIAAPFAAMLGLIHGWLPFSIFCTTSLLGSCLTCQLPETLEKPMYETMQGMMGQYIPPVSF